MSAPGGHTPTSLQNPKDRGCGILLHPTALPGPHGIGSLGEEAFRFIDFLKSSRQCVWQVLPLGPTGYGDSPYQSFSSFAGNPLLIDLDILVRDGFLAPAHLKEAPSFPEVRVDYDSVFAFKTSVLQASHSYWRGHGSSASRREFEEFCRAESRWLQDFALFMAVKRSFEEEGRTGSWTSWPAELVRREPKSMAVWQERLAAGVERQKYQQYLFFRQWGKLKAHASQQGIRIVGDLPIFVAHDSVDTWANQALFFIDAEGEPTVVSGVPPDYFSETGQLWGNPLYNWKRHKEEGYRWWIERIKATLRLVDALRLDHFRGFEAYWEIPAGEQTAVKGRWVKGPGADFFKTLKKELGGLPIIAEDLGVITAPVERLRDRFGFPGMKVLQFAFDTDAANKDLPHNYRRDCIVYTGTHDNDTTTGWYRSRQPEIQDRVRRYLGRDGHDIAWDLIRLAFASVAQTAIVPLQDTMNLGSEARMNYPSRPTGNWQWRFSRQMLNQEISGRLGELAELYNRSS